MSWFTRTTRNYSGETDLDQGTDGSSEYLKSRKIRFIIGHQNTRATVAFKPFITKYSLSIQTNTVNLSKDFLSLSSLQIATTESMFIEASFSLDLLAHSVNEAKVNIKRINELHKMFNSINKDTSTENSYLRNLYYILIGNIFTAGYTSAREINTRQELKQLGVPGFVEKFNITVDKDMGMFEDGSDLLPKKYTLEFNFKISNKAYEVNNNNKYLWLPFNADGSLRDQDTKVFPFGASGSRGKRGADGSQEWANNKNALIYIGAFSTSYYDSFKPFLDSLSFDYSYDGAKIEEMKSVGGGLKFGAEGAKVINSMKLGFSVVSHSVNDAINNTWKLQRLIRACDCYFPKEAGGSLDWDVENQKDTMLVVLINNLNSRVKVSSPVYSYDELTDHAKGYSLKSIQIDIDLSMGMFDDGNMLYFKKYNISMDLMGYNVEDNGTPYKMFQPTTEEFGNDDPIENTEQKYRNMIDHKIFK